MSQVGKTQLRGHGLRGEGTYRYDDRGNRARDYGQIVYESHTLRAKCACGALSEPGVSTNAAKRWHREHKATMRALSATESDAQGERAHGDGTAAQGSAETNSGGKR